MKPRRLLLALVGSMSLVNLAGAGTTAKVEICHFPPGNPANFQTITIGEAALLAHLAHGDFGGPCSNDCRLFSSICNDGNACTVDTCNPDGTCAYSAPTNCDDTSPCTADSCDPATGDCVHTPVSTSTSCDDGNLCTGPDHCDVNGTCRGEALQGCCMGDADCADGNLCTIDTCTLATHTCSNVAITCTPSDACHRAACSPVSGNCEQAPIQEGSLTCSPPSVVITLAPVDGPVVPKAGSATLSVNAEGFTNVTCAGTMTSPTLGTVTVTSCSSPLNWDNLAHGEVITFEVVVTGTWAGDLVVTGPVAIRTATVDALGPDIQIARPADGEVSGSPLVFSFTVSSDAVSFVCATEPQAPEAFDCIPGADNEIFYGTPGTGFVEVTTLSISAADALGNSCTKNVTAEVDVNGPVVALSVLCDSAGKCQFPAGHFDEWGQYIVDDQMCPTSTPATEIHFTGEDREGHGPVRFMCRLDGGALQDCNDAETTGVFRWGQDSALSTGQHTLVIIGFDILGNPGPLNIGAPGNFGVVVIFTVSACAP